METVTSVLLVCHHITLFQEDQELTNNSGPSSEAISLAAPIRDAQAFAAAGYANISVNEDHVGGVVRQHGSFSFSRIFEAGHDAPIYQPSTAFNLFSRTIQGLDVATGLEKITSDYSTTGPSSASQIRVTDGSKEANPPTRPECYVMLGSLAETCSSEQIAAIVDGSAIVKDYIVVSPEAAAYEA